MHAIEATLENGSITLLEPLPAHIHKARVVILFEDALPAAAVPAAILKSISPSAEAQFDALALAAWADDSVDENTDWERHFGLKP